MWVQQVGKSFARKHNQRIIQLLNHSTTNSPLKLIAPVTESVNNPSLKSSINLNINSPDHQFVQSAFRTITWSPKYQIIILHIIPLTKSRTLQIPSKPRRIITQSIRIPLTQLLNNLFAKSSNDSFNKTCHHQVARSSKYLFIKSSRAYNRIINQSLNKPKYQSTNQLYKNSRKNPVVWSPNQVITEPLSHAITLTWNHLIPCTK